MHPGDRHYRNQIVRLTDLTVTSDVIEGVTFENCTLIGPAVIVLLGAGTFKDSVFDGDVEALLWPLGSRNHVIGAIALVGCTVVGCRLQRVGLAFPEDQEEIVRRGLGLSD